MADRADLFIGAIGTPALWQIAFWPDGVAAGAARLALELGAAAPPPGASVAAPGGARLMRVEPLVFWLLGAGEAPLVASAEGAALDLSQARASLRVEGARAADLLNRFTALDLREKSFPDGAVAATGVAHSPVTVLRRDDAGAPGYDLFAARSYAQSIRDHMARHAAMMG